MRTIKELIKPERNIVFYLGSAAVRCCFLLNSEKEGFTLANGQKPTEAGDEECFVLHPDGKLCYLGWAGRMKYRSKQAGDYIKVDYEKYLDGDADFIIK